MASLQSDQIPTCPFCSFEDPDSTLLLQHINLLHPEDENAPYLVAQEGQERQPEFVPPSTATTPDVDWVECDCGEFCLLVEYSDHLDLHEAENFDDIESTGANLEHISSPDDKDSADKSRMPSLAPSG